MHRVFVDFELGAIDAGREIVVEGEEARHAVRVKRIEVGERVEVLDGRGVIVLGRVATAEAGKRDSVMRVVVESVRVCARVTPRVEVYTATPKGGRVDEMIEQLSQAGAAVWRPLETERGVVEPRDGKLARLERIARESGKQCGRAWMLEIGERIGLVEAVRNDAPGSAQQTDVVIADAGGEAYAASGAGCVRVLIGPEGGFTAEELEVARRAGARRVRFGPHVMRIETAAVVAAGVVGSRA